jgi:hypothetical protein
MSDEVKTRPMKVTAGFLVRAMCAGTKYDPQTVTAHALTDIARTMPQSFPNGLSFDQAQELLRNPLALIEPTRGKR